MAKKKAAKKAKSKKSPGLTVSAATFRRKVRAATKALQASVATKSELVAAIAARSDMSKVQVNKVLAAQTAVVASELCRKGIVKIPQIAVLRSKTRPAKKNAIVRNPATGETIRKDLPKKMSVRARPIGISKKAASCGR